MTKRALRRSPHETERRAPAYEDSKIRRLPLDRDWSPLDRECGREQGYLKTIRPKSEGQSQMLAFFFRVTLPITEAPGAIQYSSPAGTTGLSSSSVYSVIDAPVKSVRHGI